MSHTLKRARTRPLTRCRVNSLKEKSRMQGNCSSSVPNLHNFLGYDQALTKKQKTPVLLITDIGADIDDTLALLTLLSCDLLEIKAIVTSVGNGEERGRLTRGWLRKLRLPDSLPIFPYSDHLEAACSVPENFPSIEESNLGNVEETPQNILNLCREIKREYGKKLVVIGIAALTPLWKAIKLDAQNIILGTVRKLYLQGNYRLTKGRLKPSDKAYNFKNDMKAAEGVTNFFQDTTPITFLGKNAAYKINIRKENFKFWHNVLYASDLKRHKTTEYDDVGKVDLLDMAYKQMNGFRLGNPTYFAEIYPDSKKYFDDNSLLFFFQMPDSGILSHPYDPLVALACIEDLETEKRQRELSFPLLRRARSDIPFSNSTNKNISTALRSIRRSSQHLRKQKNLESRFGEEANALKGRLSRENKFYAIVPREDMVLFDRKNIQVSGVRHEGIGNDGVHPEGVSNVNLTHARLIEAVAVGLQLNSKAQKDLGWMKFC
eukprot:augustus_masked-scaffold_10-processed-gene-2.0-mRNA-1 protein AED:0.39 eAED:1.00 QI:0/-1/0/1/-1/1/1/0/489